MDFEYFRARRDALIDSLERGELNKTDFIQAHAALYTALDLKEPKVIAGSTDGLFYYQYFNTMAKHHQMCYRDLKYKDPFVAVEHRNLSDQLYAIKERVTYRLLCAVDFKGIEAYYVKATSRQLRSRLVEIVFVHEEKAILHSLDFHVVAELRARNLLPDQERASKIDSYINQRYYDV